MGVALITPFNEDGSVDYNALMKLVEYQIQNGTDFLCVLGTTAETPTLTSEEKAKIKQVIRINDVNELNVDDLHEARRIAITSGASTPTYLTNQVIEYLENYPCQKPEIKIQDIL